jgi:hypothetical protein
VIPSPGIPDVRGGTPRVLTRRQVRPSPPRWLFVPVLMIAGCDGPSEGTIQRAGAASSATAVGVEVVESAHPRWGPGDEWWVEPRPTFAFGEDPDHPAWNVVGAGRLPDGRVAILMGGHTNPRLLLSDRGGRLVKVIGGAGRGPGEFQDPQHLLLLNGDVVVWESHLGRITAFDTTGTVRSIRTIDPERLPASIREGGGQPDILLPLGLDRFLLAVVPAAPRADHFPLDQWIRTPFHIFLVEQGHEARFLGAFDGRAGAVLAGEGANPAVRIPPLFTVNSAVASGSEDARIVVSHGDDRGMYVYDRWGSLERVIRLDAPPPRITLEERESTLQRVAVANRMSHDAQGRFEGILARLPPQTTHPRFGQITMDALGYLWALERQDEGRTTHWNVFDREGRWLGTVPIPLTRIFEIGEDYVLGLHFDSLRVESVREHTLSRRRAAPDR